MTRGSFEHSLSLLLRACAGGDAPANAPGSPATGDQIAALERHWGRPLPPLYRRVLGVRRVTEALLHSIDETCELFQRMRERTAPRT
jgi:hypothetical protein